jgi:DNA-binding CsgD family transcriptional regulator
MRELCYIAIHVFDRLAEIRNLDTRITDTLTDREIDCLNWTAAGKTSAEIAEILTLSEHTVNHYLNRATKKLDTVNRTQAVAKALRIGLIK